MLPPIVVVGLPFVVDNESRIIELLVQKKRLKCAFLWRGLESTGFQPHDNFCLSYAFSVHYVPNVAILMGQRE
jgi:hypothetical protein